MEFSKQIKTSKSDEYYTPAYDVQVILPFLKTRGFKHVWCPFDKECSELFDSKARYELFKNNNFELLIPKGRIRFFDKNMIARNSPNFQSVYVCSGILDNQTEFTDMER